jgi:hypothetical protein
MNIITDMKTSFYLCILVVFLFFSCSKEKEKSLDIQDINGYWEIVQAQNPYGKNVIYNINTQVDYFEIKDSLGFRKKLKPDLNGNYTTSKAVERFTWKNENDTLRLKYKTPMDTWEVDVLRLNDSLMLIKNKDDFLYTYKRFEAININAE